MNWFAIGGGAGMLIAAVASYRRGIMTRVQAVLTGAAGALFVVLGAGWS
jgi:hypothetical protein